MTNIPNDGAVLVTVPASTFHISETFAFCPTFEYVKELLWRLSKASGFDRRDGLSSYGAVLVTVPASTFHISETFAFCSTPDCYLHELQTLSSRQSAGSISGYHKTCRLLNQESGYRTNPSLGKNQLLPSSVSEYRVVGKAPDQLAAITRYVDYLIDSVNKYMPVVACCGGVGN
ncbi:hypothetical protein ACTFIZ_001013 [Dictyostelium cf. discoideum]